METSPKIQKITKYGYRFLALLASFVTGWIVYTIGVAIFPYDGIMAILFQAVFGAIITGMIVMVSWLIGLIVRKYISQKFLPGYRAHLIGISICIFFLVFGYSLGLKGTYFDSELGTTFQSINPIITITGYILIIFLIANWPIKTKKV